LRRQIIYFPRSELEGRCTGCRLCELMCSLKHANVFSPDRARIRVVSFEGGIDIPATCTQCGLCLEKCPLDLIKLNDGTGAITIDEERCTGCGVCVDWCPIGAITTDPKTSKALKCDLCSGSPECVRYCSSKVLHLVKTSSARSLDSRRRMFASVLAGEELILRNYSPGATGLRSLQKILGKEGR